MNRLIIFLLTAAVFIIAGSGAIYHIESLHEDAQINSLLDAFWWTVSTITTVGYGDLVPVSDAGKVFGIFYMLLAIGILGVIISSLATDFYKKRFESHAEPSEPQKLILEKIQELEKKSENQDKLFKEILEKLNEINSKEK